jgi:hypothetical protein
MFSAFKNKQLEEKRNAKTPRKAAKGAEGKSLTLKVVLFCFLSFSLASLR